MAKKRITVKEAREMLHDINCAAVEGDHEKAHGLEDQLWERILYTIGNPTSILSTGNFSDAYTWAEHGQESKQLARLALKSKQIRFARYTA